MFSMYAIILALAALILERHTISILLVVVCVLLGWPFSIIITTPMVIYALRTIGNLKRVFV